jgi:uroporphyrinogen-III synthase
VIPFVVAPLTGVTVLVTRPDDQAQSLCTRIAALGGEAILFPAMAIEQIEVAVHFGACDWIIFTSVNAVKYGLAHVSRNDAIRIAAIGKSTAAALAENNVTIHAVPDKDATSESLLTHPALQNVAKQRVVIVKGEGGRELLRETLSERGAEIRTLDVYRRIRPQPDSSLLREVESRWREAGIGIVTLTSVEMLENLLSILTAEGRDLLAKTPFVTVSERIVAAARAQGLTGVGVLARGADDASVVGAIAAWHARAR